MEGFYIAVLVIAIVILMLILTTIGVAMRKANQGVEWPPTGGRCPDGWEEDVTTPGKCYVRSDMVNSGKVTPESAGTSGSTVANATKGYVFAADTYTTWINGDKWRELGSISHMDSPGNTKLSADGTSNFKYFNVGDTIKIGTTESTVASKDDTVSPAILTLSVAISTTPTFPVKYYGKRISVDFNNNVYKGNDDGATKCKRKIWTDANEIQWDGVSNYNKCS